MEKDAKKQNIDKYEFKLGQSNKRKSQMQKQIDEQLSLNNEDNNEKNNLILLERKFYGSTSEEIACEIFDEMDNLLRNQNYRLKATLLDPLSNICGKDSAEKIIDKFVSEKVVPSFNFYYDEGQTNISTVLSLRNIPQDILTYCSHDNNNLDVYKKEVELHFEKSKQKYIENYQTKCLLQIQLNLLKKIKSFRDNKWESKDIVKTQFDRIVDSIHNPIDYSIIQSNIDTYNTKLQDLYNQLND